MIVKIRESFREEKKREGKIVRESTIRRVIWSRVSPDIDRPAGCGRRCREPGILQFWGGVVVVARLGDVDGKGGWGRGEGRNNLGVPRLEISGPAIQQVLPVPLAVVRYF